MASIDHVPRDRDAGRLLREWRLDKGFSPEALSWELRRAKLQSVSGKQIRRIENTGVIPTPRVMFALATYFDARPSDVWRKSLRRTVAA
jgi:transcriptional regulator with XRE-family HTH domain